MPQPVRTVAVVASTSTTRHAVRAIALFETTKGVLVLLVGSGLLSLVHANLDTIAVALVRHAHLNPASQYPHIFLDAISHVGRADLVWLAAGALVYASARLAEAWGLLQGRAWAEWLAAISGAVYVPIELVELVRRPGMLSLLLLALNLAVVAVMARSLALRRRS